MAARGSVCLAPTAKGHAQAMMAPTPKGRPAVPSIPLTEDITT